MSLQHYNFIQEDLKNLFNIVSPKEIEQLRKNNVCITGGAGFIGTWISNIIHYLNENHDFQTKVIVIDRDIEKAHKNSPHLLNSKYFEFNREDTRYIVELPKNLNYIIHAAASPNTNEHVTNPIEIMSTISDGTEAVLRASERISDLKMFLNLSSSLVYGNFMNLNRNIKESDYFTSSESISTNFYAEAKRYSEILSDAFRQQFRMPIVTMRPFTLIGPYQLLSGPWAFNNFINDAINRKTIKVLGDGSTVRALLYASDTAFWILKTLVHAESGSKYNLGSPEGVSIKELAGKIQSYLNVSNDVHFSAGMSAAHKKSYMVADTETIQNKFNLKLTVPLDKAIERTIKWHLIK